MSKFVRSSERWENGEDVEDEVFYDRGELDFNSNSNTTTNNSSVNILADELAEEHKEKQEQQQQSQVQRRSNTKLHELEHGDPHGMEIMNNKVTLDVHTVMNRTSVTLDDAVKVPVALQLPSRRTMFDVLMHLHNNSSNNSCSGDIEIGNANNDASNSKKRNNNVVMITSSGVIGGINTDSDSPVMFYSEEKEEQIIENETKLRDMNSSDKTEYKRETVKEIPRANDIFDSIEQHGKVQSDNNNIICKSRENKEIMHFDPHVLPESISDFDDSDEESTNTSLHITHSSNNKSINEYNKHTKEMFDNKYNDKKHENNDKFTVQYVLEQEEERGIEKERKVCEGEPDRGANRNSTLECTSSHTSKAHNNRSSVLELFDEQEEVAMQRTSSSAFKANTQSSSPTPTMESNKVSQTIYDLDVMQDNFVDHNSTTQYNLNNNTISDRINDKYSLHHTTSLDTLASSLPHHSAILNSQETPQYVHLQPLSALQSQQATQPILSYYINYTNTMQEETEEYKKNTLTNKNTHGTQPLSSSTEQNVLSTNRMSNSFTKHNRCVNEIGKPVALTLHSLAKRTANNLHSAILSNFTSNKGNNISNSHMSLYMKNIAGNNVTSGANNALHLSTQSSVWSTQPMSQILSTQEFPQPQSELQEEQQQLMLLNYYLLSKPASRFVTTAANINDNNNLSHMNYSQNT